MYIHSVPMCNSILNGDLVGDTGNSHALLTFRVKVSAPSVGSEFVLDLDYEHVIPHIGAHGVVGPPERPVGADRPLLTVATHRHS